MSEHPVLDQQERVVAERYVAKLERAAKSWPCVRVMILVLCLFVLSVALVWMWGFWQDMKIRYDVIDKIEQPYPRNITPGDDWYKSELKRLALLVHRSSQGQMLTIIQGVVSVMLLFTVALVAYGLIKHWNDGSEKRLVARLARWQLEQWK